MLRPLGFEVVEAVNGREGLEIAHSEKPHLILMDITMPEMDGLEATCRLRGMEAFKEVPIIAVSASVSGIDSDKSLEAGANVFLPKPIDMGQLLRQIATLLPLDWTYDRPEEKTAAEPEATGFMVVPPLEEMEVLHRLARLGNMRDILERATYLAELDQRYRPFAHQLHLLAKGYQTKAILLLVERCLNGEQVSSS